MSKKTLNKANLQELGAERLADLLLEVSTGSADIKRRLRLELSHNLGPSELARDIRKRLVSLRRAKSFVGWRKRKALVKDLRVQLDMIIDKVAPDAPVEAFELLWQFLELAPSIYARVDDSSGDVAAVFHAAVDALGSVASQAMPDPAKLAARIWDVLRDDGDGAFDGLIGQLAPSLGDAGLDHLADLIKADADIPPDRQEPHAALQFLRDLRGTGANSAKNRKLRVIRLHLREIAAAKGDADAYIALYSAAELARPRIATQIAAMLADKGAFDRALGVLQAAIPRSNDPGRPAWDTAYIETLVVLDRVDQAQAHRWKCFLDTLDAQMLRDYLRVMPDFDDIEAEDAAKAHVQHFPDITAAIAFFLAWQDPRSLAQLIETRVSELDGELHDLLTQAADALRTHHPLAAVLCWRTMIRVVLRDSRKSRYGHAADHLMDCAAADADIPDYGAFLSHGTFVEKLRQRYAHRTSFWAM